MMLTRERQTIEDASPFGLSMASETPAQPSAPRTLPATALGRPTVEPFEEPDQTNLMISIASSLLESGNYPAARRLVRSMRSVPEGNRVLQALRKVFEPPRIRRGDPEHASLSIDVSRLKEESVRYRGQWIAIDGGRLLAHAPTLLELKALLQRDYPDRRPLLHPVD